MHPSSLSRCRRQQNIPRVIVVVLAVLLELSACQADRLEQSAPAASTPQGEPVQAEELRYLALGDSYTIGESVAPEERWPVQLAAELRRQGYPAAEAQIIARTGWTTGELAAAIADAAPQGPYDLVTLLIGVNNQYRGLPADEYQAEFQALLQQAIDFAGGDPQRVVVLSIPDWGVTPFAHGRDSQRVASQIDQYNRINRQETLAAGAHYVDITLLSRQAAEDRSLLAGDGLHPSGKMYAGWVSLALPAVIQAIKR